MKTTQLKEIIKKVIREEMNNPAPVTIPKPTTTPQTPVRRRTLKPPKTAPKTEPKAEGKINEDDKALVAKIVQKYKWLSQKKL